MRETAPTLTREELHALRYPLAAGNAAKHLAVLAKLGWVDDEPNIRDERTVFYGPHPCDRCGNMIVRAEFAHGGQAFDQPEGPIYPNTLWSWHDCGHDRPRPAPHQVRPHTPGVAPVPRDALVEAADDALRAVRSSSLSSEPRNG